MDAYISSVVSLPVEGVNLYTIKKELTIKVWDPVKEKATRVKTFSLSRGYIHVPRQIGLQYIADYDLTPVWRTSSGYKDFQHTKPIVLLDYQKPWVDEVTTRFKNGDSDITAMAVTGKGKTVMSLEIIRRLGRTALVFVDQEFLRDQWIDNAKKFLKLKDSDIGLIQGKVCDYNDKTLVIAMVQSLFKKKHHESVYNYFGTVVFDESHTLGAEQFSKVLGQFTAEHRLAISATPDRTDALQKVLEFNLGPVKVELQDKHLVSTVRYVEYDGVVSWYSNVSPKAGRFIKELVGDSRRNILLSTIIKYLADQDRQVLVVSDRIEHLEHLMSLCYFLGVPESDMGLVTGYRNVWKYAKDPTPPRRPYGLQANTEYTPVKLQQVSKRIPKPELDFAKEEAKLIFATYGMFSKGVDVPRLSAGVDCTPRSKAQQVHGRILRKDKGKKVPLWVTIRDFMSYKAEYQFSKRLIEYTKSNAEIVQWQLGKGIRTRDVVELRHQVERRIQRLKLAEIVTNVDGNYIVVTKSTGRQPSVEAEKPTGRRTRRKRK